MTTEQAHSFIAEMSERIGDCFNPDTPFEEYENSRGERMFGDSTAPELNAKMESAIDVLSENGLDAHLIAFDVLASGDWIATDEERSYGPRR